MNALFEVAAADVADTSDDCYTPRWIFDAAGIVFDMDVSAPVDPDRRHCPARRYLTPIEDGLVQPWEGMAWMNPPFSKIAPWASRFAAHHCGIAVLPAMRAVRWLEPIMSCADAIALLSVDFQRPDGSLRTVPSLILMVGCGPVAVGAVGRVAAADKYVRGAYHVRN